MYKIQVGLSQLLEGRGKKGEMGNQIATACLEISEEAT